VGFRVGSSNNNIVLQIHYENMNNLTNQVDSSGLTIHSTPFLRKHDAGVLLAGELQGLLRIPPQLPLVSISNTCNNTCSTGDFFVFGYLLHMHLLGVSISGEVWRNGVKISSVREPNYDFNRQDINRFDPPIKIAQYDQIKTICNYNTMSKIETTMGGFSSKEEM
jgi:hypothetical protein